MTIIYVPRLIESAEQAEALPVGSVLIRHRDDETTRVATRIHRGPSPDHVWRAGDGFHRHEGVVGMQALVPIEAEEEWTVGHEGPAWAPGTEEWAREFQTHEPGRRLFRRSTTPWEDA